MLGSCPESPNIKKSLTGNKKKVNDSIVNEQSLNFPGLKITNIKSKVNSKPIIPKIIAHHKIQSRDSSINSQRTKNIIKLVEFSFDGSLDLSPSQNEHNPLTDSLIKPVVPSKQNAFMKKSIYDKTIDLDLCTDVAAALACDEIDKVSHLPSDDSKKIEINMKQISERKMEKFNDIFNLPLTDRKESPLQVRFNGNRRQLSERKYHEELQFQNKLYSYILDNPTFSP